MNKLTFEKLRKANKSRVPLFGHGDLYSADGWNIAEWGNALAGETGEFCNIAKKIIRQMPLDPNTTELIQCAAEELADVICYADLCAARLGVDLGQAVQDKFNKVSRKFGFPQQIGFCDNENEN